MKLIGYLRVSSDSQLDGYGLNAQEDAIRGWARTQRHRLVRVVSDLGVSGATDAVDRPGLSDVLTAIKSGEAEGLIIARLDRLARALTVQEATLAVIWRSGGQVFTADSGMVLVDDPDDPMRTALRQVVGVFAELDRRMVTKRLRDGRAAKAMAGRKSVGAYRYGYTGAGKGKNRDSAPHAEEQEVIRLILRRRGDGCSYRAIAAELDACGYAPRRAERWSPMTVRSIDRMNQSSAIRA
jgi:DNA invertase Pin-like site-specific DNA recombinase